MKKTPFKIVIAVLLVIVVGGSIAAAAYFYVQYKKIKDNPNIIAQQEAKSITDNIQKYMDLPTNEQPTVATVTNKDELSKEEFFKRSENGDKIIVYTNARKAILYRPSTNRVIEFAPLIIGSPVATASAQNTNSNYDIVTTTRIAIYNGTAIANLATTIEGKIGTIEGASVVSKGNAIKKDYTETLVIDLEGKHPEIAQTIAEAINGVVSSTLPDGETTPPNADILIIAAQ